MLKSSLNPAVNAALNTIRESLNEQKQVSFVYHSWLPFANLSLQGFKFPQIPEREIPRLSLIPIVATTGVLMGSTMSTAHNRHVPTPVSYQMDIKSSIADLMMKYAQFGLVRVQSLDTDVDRIEEAVNLFQIITPGLNYDTPLEVIPEYFGIESPVDFQFTRKRKLLKTTALDYLSDAVTDEAEFSRGEQAIAVLGQSAAVSHIVALEPANGILPKTIRSISERLKFRFDLVDEWLVRQFPSYDSKGGLSQAKEESGTDLIKQLVELLAAKQAPEPAPTNAIPAFSEPLEAEVEEGAVAKRSCIAVKKDGEFCKGFAIEGSDFCRFHNKALSE
jgi:hypothetical protein